MPGGEFPDVTGGALATSARQNDVQHRIVNHFTNASQRDSLWPNPPEGSVCWLSDVDLLQVFHDSVWNQLVEEGFLSTNYMPRTGGAFSGEVDAVKLSNTAAQNDSDQKFRKIAIGATPVAELVGDMWVDRTGAVGVLRRWNGSIWEELLTGV